MINCRIYKRSTNLLIRTHTIKNLFRKTRKKSHNNRNYNICFVLIELKFSKINFYTKKNLKKHSTTKKTNNENNEND